MSTEAERIGAGGRPRPPLTPEARLRPGLDPEDGTPVELEGGHTWHLARPRLGYRPRLSPDGQAAGVRVVEGRFGPRYSELFERLERADSDQALFEALLPASAILLRERYDLDQAEVERLLTIYPDDEEGGADRLRALMAAAAGRRHRPKPSAATSEPAPWPTA
jgi:hypothetical protein